MQRYMVVRGLQSIVTLFAISIVIFAISRATGNPLDILLPIEATQEDYEVVGKALGLDKPLPVQYWVFISKAAVGDFGKSIRAKRPVNELILQRLPNSARLSAVAIGMAMFIGMPLAVVAAVRKGRAIDTVCKLLAVTGQSIPGFWLGIMLILALAVQWQIFPPFGAGGPMHYILPGFTLGWWISAGIMRLLRSSMLDTLDTEYVKLARIKGVAERWVIWRHALRNALIPVVTFAGFYFAITISAAIVVETVFAWPGVGRLAYEAVMWRDFPVIQGVVLVIGAIAILMNFIVDVLYAYLDPKIRY